MRTTVSWKDGGALLSQTFLVMLIATLVSADIPPTKVKTCNKCDVSEDNYRGPTWAYPCMRGYQGAKKEDVPCQEGQNANGCFRRLTVLGGKKVMGSGGCFDMSKRTCVEEVTKVKFNTEGCIPETAIDPAMNKELLTKCGIVSLEEGPGEATTAATRRRKREAADEYKGYICICFGDGCNNQGGGLGPRSGNDTNAAVPAANSLSAVWIGVVTGMGLVGGNYLVKK